MKAKYVYIHYHKNNLYKLYKGEELIILCDSPIVFDRLVKKRKIDFSLYEKKTIKGFLKCTVIKYLEIDLNE